MNLKRFILMFFICVSSFMIYTNNVNAANSNNIKSLPNITYNSSNATISNWSVVGTTYFNFDLKPTNINSTMTLSFDNITIPQYSNYFTFPLSLLNMSNDVTLSCNNEYIAANILEDINFSTTYADGSQAQNSGSIESSSSTYRYCNSFHYNNDDFGLYIHFTASNNNQYSCPIVSSGNEFIAICPIQSGLSNGESSFNSITIRTFYSNPNTDTFRFRVSDKVTFSIDSTQTILNAISNQTNSINSKLDELKQNQQATTQAVQEQTNTMKDSSIDNSNTSSSTSSWSNKNATNGTITNLLTLPISLLQNILNGIQTSCSNFSLGTLFDTELFLPCINLSNLIGNTLFNVIDLLFSGFMILNIAKKLIKIFNDFTNLKSNQIDEIYSNGGGSN